MYRVDSIYAKQCGYLKLLVYTKNYKEGEGSDIKALIQDNETKQKRMIDGNELYSLIGAGQVMFGAVIEKSGARAVTLCSEIAASTYKEFSYVGTYTDTEFYDMIDESNRKNAVMWIMTGSSLSFGDECSVETGIIDLDYLMLNNPNGVAFYSTLSRKNRAEDNSLTNLLDHLIHCDIGSEVFVDGKRFFLKERTSSRSCEVHCYSMSGKLLLELL